MMKHLAGDEILKLIQFPEANLKKNALIYGASSKGTFNLILETNENKEELFRGKEEKMKVV